MEKEQPKSVTIPFVADEETKEWLDQECERQYGRSRSSLLREIIEFYREYRHLVRVEKKTQNGAK